MNRLERYVSTLLVVVSSAGCVGPDASSSSASPDGERWIHSLAPYIWVPTIDADSTVDGGTVSLDLSQGDIIDHLKFAASGRYEAWKGRRGYIIDLQWVRLFDDPTLPVPPPYPASNKLDIDIRQGTLDLMIAHRLKMLEPNALGTTIDAFGGIRYSYLKQEISPTGLPSLGGSEDWVEPVIGARFVNRITDKWEWTFRADASGFGVGSGSDLTWNALLGAGYEVSEKRSVRFGYKWYSLDYSHGGGANKFGFDGTMQGPYFGYIFRF